MMKVSSEVLRLQVLVNNRAVQEYRGPSNTTFIEGRLGSEFELEITNLTPRRILVHPTVDGLSAMSGELASKDDSSHGYILHSHQCMRIPGWRLNNSEVAKFVFAGQGQSYAEQTGRGADKGVIACTVWEEKIKWYQVDHTPAQTPMFYDYRYNSGPMRSRGCGGGGRFTCNSLPSVTVNCCNDTGQQPTSGEFIGYNSAQNLGTGFGKTAEHQTVTVSFAAEDHPTCTAVIYYDDIQGLRRRGVKIPPPKPEHKLPNPFPRDNVGCKPPDGWQR